MTDQLRLTPEQEAFLALDRLLRVDAQSLTLLQQLRLSRAMAALRKLLFAAAAEPVRPMRKFCIVRVVREDEEWPDWFDQKANSEDPNGAA